MGPSGETGLDQRCHLSLPFERPRSPRATVDGAAVPLLTAGAQDLLRIGEGTSNPNLPLQCGGYNGHFLACVCVWVQARTRMREGHTFPRMTPPPLLTDSFLSVTGPILLGISISMLVLHTFRDQHFEFPLALTFAQRSRKP